MLCQQVLSQLINCPKQPATAKTPYPIIFNVMVQIVQLFPPIRQEPIRNFLTRWLGKGRHGRVDGCFLFLIQEEEIKIWQDLHNLMTKFTPVVVSRVETAMIKILHPAVLTVTTMACWNPTGRMPFSADETRAGKGTSESCARIL